LAERGRLRTPAITVSISPRKRSTSDGPRRPGRSRKFATRWETFSILRKTAQALMESPPVLVYEPQWCEEQYLFKTGCFPKKIFLLHGSTPQAGSDKPPGPRRVFFTPV